MLDLDFVRAQFPAFAEPALAGQAFFENAGGSYTCAQVIARLTRFYTQRKVQPYAPYTAAQLGGAEMDEARDRLSALLGVGPDELSFGPSTTQNAYVLAQAFGDWLQPGEAIVVSNQDHEANAGAWRGLGVRGIEIREWQIDPETGRLDPGDLDGLLDGARLLCFPHCSNVIGEINDVASICAKARAAGAVTCVDGVSYAPHGLPDIGALGADIYLFSSYKTYGPHQGLMVVRRALAEALPNQGHSFNGGDLTKRFTPAGPDHAQVAACAGIADYIDALYAHHFPDLAAPKAQEAQEAQEALLQPAKVQGAAVHDLMRTHEETLLQPLLDYVAGRNDLRLLGPRDAARRAPTVAMLCPKAGEAVAADLAAHGILAGGGDFYATRPLQAMGVDLDHGVLRLSFVHYTSQAEVTRAIEALDAVLST